MEREALPAPVEALVADDEIVVRKRDLALAFAKEAAVVLAASAVKIGSRTMSWALTGLALGGLFVASWWVIGVLPTVWWGALIWSVLVVAAAVGGFGYVGWIRGLGRAGIYVGCERGMVPYLVGLLLDRVTGLARKSRRVSGALDKGESVLGNLPLHQWETWLTAGVEDYLGSDDPVMGNEGNLVTRFFRRFLVARIQRYLLRIVRQEIAADGSGGGVSVQRVREVALVKCADMLEETVEGAMFTHLAIGLGVSLLVYAVPFALTYFAVW